MTRAILAAIAEQLSAIALADEARARASRELVALVEQLAAESESTEVWTSRELPPGVSARAFNRIARELAARGDTRSKKIGRVHVVERSAFASASTTRAPEAAPPTNVHRLAERLARVGARPAKGARA